MRCNYAMYPSHLKSHGLVAQSGMGLVGAIFMIVIVALLSVAMSRMLDTDQRTQSYEILSLKAFLAAESGAQLAVNRLLPPAGGGSCSDVTFDFDDSALRFCHAETVCTSIPVGSKVFYTITSSSECTAGTFVTGRVVQVRVKE